MTVYIVCSSWRHSFYVEDVFDTKAGAEADVDRRQKRDVGELTHPDGYKIVERVVQKSAQLKLM